jgi:S-adenosylmethionine-diacylglycerol 3-amino-3-carboxypropyl transferase
MATKTTTLALPRRKAAGVSCAPHRGFADWMHGRLFNYLFGRSLLFNTCWEDPAIDRQALDLGPDDTLLAITSAGCNVLDFVLAGPRLVHAVDANPRQTALLELKVAGLRRLDFGTFFRIFGEGQCPGFKRLYRAQLRPALSPSARAFWDRHTRWFDGKDDSDSFYWHGLSGSFARAMRLYTRARPGLRQGLEALLEAPTLEEQSRIFVREVEPKLWSRGVKHALRSPIVLTLLGVPPGQEAIVRTEDLGGVPGLVHRALLHVFCEVPMRTNYFWSLYIRGHYTRDCCPEYLRPAEFMRLRDGLVDRIRIRTCTVAEFLRSNPEPITRFDLLDHMDWLGVHDPAALAEEWKWILARAAPGARIIFRSGAEHPPFLDELRVAPPGGKPMRLRDRLLFHADLAKRLSRLDRVGTYGSFHIADIRPGGGVRR